VTVGACRYRRASWKTAARSSGSGSTDGKRSSYWRLRAGVAAPELFLEREGYGKKFHFSLHASGQGHLTERRKERIVWARPGEVVPG
jgi:hypothetical protein